MPIFTCVVNLFSEIKSNQNIVINGLEGSSVRKFSLFSETKSNQNIVILMEGSSVTKIKLNKIL
jgi:hypothetical protein